MKKPIPLTKTRTPIRHLEALLDKFDNHPNKARFTEIESSVHVMLYWLLKELKRRK